VLVCGCNSHQNEQGNIAWMGHPMSMDEPWDRLSRFVAFVSFCSRLVCTKQLTE
jgi:hypothetical protein